jgi:hypothetical protein
MGPTQCASQLLHRKRQRTAALQDASRVPCIVEIRVSVLRHLIQLHPEPARIRDPCQAAAVKFVPEFLRLKQVLD